MIKLEEGIYFLDEKIEFPSLNQMKGDLVAIGGDLSFDRLIEAYKNGIFPWFIDDYGLIHWYSPVRRCVFFLDEFKVSKSLKKVIKNKGFSVSINKDFLGVIKGCANREETWIDDEFIEAFYNLHKKGVCYSIEVYLDNKLVGGLYGEIINGIFIGESMFSKVSNASKVALAYLVAIANDLNIKLIDAQVGNEHLFSLGAREISREEYFRYLNY